MPRPQVRLETRLEPVQPVRADAASRGSLRSGAWRRSSHGLYVPTDVGTSTEQRVIEAAARLPPGGAVGGWAAAFWYGVPYLDGQRSGEPLPVLLNVRDTGQIRASPGITVCRARLAPEDVSTVRGLPVTTPTRTAFDGARLALSLTEAVIFVDLMLASGLVTERELASYLRDHRPAWKGVGQARDALRFADPATCSPQETRLRMFWMITCQLPRPLVNQPVFDAAGVLLGFADLLDPDAGVVGEYDGEQHRELDAHARDNVREERLEATGLVVTRVTSVDLRTSGRADAVLRLQDAWERGERRDRSRDAWTLVPPSWYRYGSA